VSLVEDTITLREYVDLSCRRIADSVTALESRLTEISREHTQSHAREHQMVELAVSKAETAMTERLAGMNEFRQQISDERGSYMTKAEFDRFENALREWQSMTTGLISQQQNLWSNLQGKITSFGGLLGIVSIVSLLVALWARLG